MEKKQVKTKKTPKTDKQVVQKTEDTQKEQAITEKENRLNSAAENKITRYYSWGAYILFFIPLLFNAKNKEVRFHVNQGFWLNICEIVAIVLIWLFNLGYHSTTIPQWLNITCFILFIVAVLFCALLFMLVIYLVIMCIIENGKEIKLLNKIKIFNRK